MVQRRTKSPFINKKSGTQRARRLCPSAPGGSKVGRQIRNQERSGGMGRTDRERSAPVVVGLER